ncbi:hypothetical protein [Nonomuraea endophytica]|uniref:hypothetical protein n=1 Tax=Nonomuraea endophytica TaxID=714136 RepID=UPI0037CC7BE0
MLPELSQPPDHLLVTPASPNDLHLYLIFRVEPDRGPQESARVALATLGAHVARELESRGLEMAGPKRMEIRYVCRQEDTQWMACLPDEASYGAANIRVKTRPLTLAGQSAVRGADLPLGPQLRFRQLALLAPEVP